MPKYTIFYTNRDGTETEDIEADSPEDAMHEAYIQCWNYVGDLIAYGVEGHPDLPDPGESEAKLILSSGKGLSIEEAKDALEEARDLIGRSNFNHKAEKWIGKYFPIEISKDSKESARLSAKELAEALKPS